jgi:hypothetical protein
MDIRKKFRNLQNIDYYIKREPGPTLEKLSDNKKTAYQKNSWEPGYSAQENKDIHRNQAEASYIAML